MGPEPIAVVDTPAALVGEGLPAGVLVPYLLTGAMLAIAYGSSFLLADSLQAAGHDAARAGAIISAGTVATLAGLIFAGRLADRTGIVPLIAIAALLTAAAMACFALIDVGGLLPAFAGSLLLGLGWAVYYILAPIPLIRAIRPAARLEALTLLSGAQMLGIGISAPLGHLMARHVGGLSFVYASYAFLCLLACLCAMLAQGQLSGRPQSPLNTVGLSFAATAGILRARTALPILMMGLAAAIFAGLSIFQGVYARSRGLAPDAFFLTFTATTVVLRFSVASLIGKLPLHRLALCLFTVTLAGIALLAVNSGSLILYVMASVLFAAGYGLTYATLNAMVVNFAEECNLSVPAASQVFTLGYFVGSLSFPYVAGQIVAARGIDAVLAVAMGLALANLATAGLMLRRRPRGNDTSNTSGDVSAK